MENVAISANLETPFPLRRMFFTRIIPGIIFSVVVLTALSLFGVKSLARGIYLELAKSRAEAIVETIKASEPDAWDTLLTTRHPDVFLQTNDGHRLLAAFEKNMTDKRTSNFKLYNPSRVLIYSKITGAIGKYEDNPALDSVFRDSTPLILPKETSSQNELYIPLLNRQGRLSVVFELYEKEVFLDKLVLKNIVPPLLLPSAMLILLTVYMYLIVNRAQNDINERSNNMTLMRKQLERFVSVNTYDFALGQSSDDGSAVKRISTTIFYSDVRDFTSFSDLHPPTAIVDFLNTVMTVQIELIQKHGGDVDKMIGDAVMARFDGANGENNAITAGREIIEALNQMKLERNIGIGILAGDVLSCTIGSRDRKDFTIIGDSVNLTARLCSAALTEEIVVEDRTLRHSGFDPGDFTNPENIQVKGHEFPLEVRRWRFDAVRDGQGKTETIIPKT